jgi:hypothetical protein
MGERFRKEARMRLIAVVLLLLGPACSSSSAPVVDQGPGTPDKPQAPAEQGGGSKEARASEARPPDTKPAVPAHWELVTGALARTEHTATVLKDGRVLIVGGRTDTGSPPTTAKTSLYDPKTGTLTDGPLLKAARMDHSATLLGDGRVLVVGGASESGIGIASSELYDPNGNSWSAGPSMPSPRMGHTATVLASGDVLIAGGFAYGAHLGSLMLYKPSAGAPGSWSSVPAVLATPRSAHAAVRLSSGKVLFIGGAADTDILDTIEIFDSTTGGISTAAAKLTEKRNLPTADLLANGKVIVVGGNDAKHDDVYDPATDKVSALSHLGDPPERHASVTLLDARVLVCGSDFTPGDRAEIFSTDGGGTWNGAPSMKAPRYGHTASLLADGSVLVVGGFFPEWTFTTSIERFYP